MDKQKEEQRSNFSSAITNMLDSLALVDIEDQKEALLSAWDRVKDQNDSRFKEEFRTQLHRLLWVYLYNTSNSSQLTSRESADILITTLLDMFTKPGSELKSFLMTNQIEGLSINDFREFIRELRINKPYFYALVNIE